MNMKNNIYENIHRIKEVMGLNEELIDLDAYDSNEDIIKSMKIVDTLPNGNVLINIKLDLFIPISKSQGLKHLLTITNEWDSSMRIVDSRDVFLINSDSTDKYLQQAWHVIRYTLTHEIFRKGLSVEELMHNIYTPYREHNKNRRDSVGHEAYKHTERENIKAHKRSIRKLERLIQSASLNNTNVQQPTNVEPDMSVDNAQEPVDNTPQKNNNLWTSTSSWASE